MPYMVCLQPIGDGHRGLIHHSSVLSSVRANITVTRRIRDRSCYRFYNNFCGLQNFNTASVSLILILLHLNIKQLNSQDWNFGIWFVLQVKSGFCLVVHIRYRDIWARTTSPNPNIKVYIGAPASSSAAGSGYVPISTLSSIAVKMRQSFPSFGGVMLWDASQAYGLFVLLRRETTF